jgi:hypothetical protein
MSTSVSGILYIHVAFDWGEEIDLDRARRLVPSEYLDLARRRRTPPTIAYRPAPLRVALGDVALELAELGRVNAAAGATIFDFAAVSLSLRVPFNLPTERLTSLAATLAEPTSLVRVARAAVAPLHRQLLPAIHDPAWQDDLSEEYFVFQLPPEGSLAPLDGLIDPSRGPHAGWIAGLLRLEDSPLSTDEINEALRRHIRYGPEDLLVADWAAAVLVDRDCDETLQTMEFCNLQLLELRHIDNRLDATLSAAYRLIHPLTHTWLPFWRMHARPLRVLGELKVEANSLFERISNVLKLVGDQYLARVYRLVAGRFHFEEWERNIQRKLEAAEGVYQVLSDQAATFRLELLELLVVVLILLEIVLAFFH